MASTGSTARRKGGSRKSTLKSGATANGSGVMTAPDTTEAAIERLNAAVVAFNGGDIEGAERHYTAVRDMLPDNPDALHGLGTIALTRGDVKTALPMLQRATETIKVPGQFFVNLAVALEAAGQPDHAISTLKRAISQDRNDPTLHRSLGVFHVNRGHEDKAIRSLKRAAKLDPTLDRIHLMLGDLYFRHQDAAKAVEHYRLHLSRNPDDIAVLNKTAMILGSAGDHAAVFELLEPAIERGLEDPDLFNNFGAVHFKMGRMEEAEKYIRRAQELDPSRWQFLSNLGGIHMANEQVDAAVAVFEEIYEKAPDNAEAACDLAAVYNRAGRPNDAIELLEKTAETAPDYEPVWTVLGLALGAKHDYLAAIEAFRKAIEIDPLSIHANASLALSLKIMGQPDESNFFAHKTMHLPGYTSMHFSNLLQAFNATCDHDGLASLGDIRKLVEAVPPGALPGCIFDLMLVATDGPSSKWLLDTHRRWADAVADQVAGSPLPPLEAHPKHDKLRVGFVSSDLRRHSVGRQIMGLLRHFDRDRFEFHGFTALRVEGDEMQRDIVELMTGFQFFENLSPRDLAQSIRGKEIDILFDLNGITLGSRADVVSYRAAPIQITWLGYPFSTGLPGMDYILLDDRLAIEGGGYFTEKQLVKEGPWLTISEYGDIPIADEPPCVDNGFITFGTLNNPYKFTPKTIALWSDVLNRVPDSRFVICRTELDSKVLCANILNAFAKHGIAGERIGFYNNREKNVYFMSCYNGLDITLDTIPVTGGTTTCDAMWMGAPVITLVGEAYHQRVSYALLDRVGLGELCAFTDEEYVEKAVALANDVESIRFLRHNLRDVVAESELNNGPLFAKHFCDMLERVAAEHGLT